MDLLGLTCAQLVDVFRQTYDRGEYHAHALYRAFYGSINFRIDELPEFSDAPLLRHRIQQDLDMSTPCIAAKESLEGVSKMVFQLSDGRTIETVVIPMANHVTVCISCQVGCRMACRFCQTGRSGWIRNLSAAEIVAQVYAVKVGMGISVRNVVFMGMGEPLDNYNAVTQAIRVMADQRGLNIAKRHITLSTVGLPHRIQQLTDLNWSHLKLALSLNAPNDTIRSALMPVNQTYPMDQLKEAIAAYPLARGNALFIAYVLIKGVNDQPEHARELALYFKDLPVKLNLIPYNPTQQSPFSPPWEKDINRFHQALIDQHIFVRLRNAKGAQIHSACGQLGGDGH